MENVHRDHRKRLKEEFRKRGIEYFEDHKVLELLLFYAIPRTDTNPIAHELIKRFGSFSGVFTASRDMLQEVEGVGLEAATYLNLLGEFAKRYMVDCYSSTKVIKSCEDAKQYMKHQFLNDTMERVILVCLDTSGKIVYSDTIATGQLDRVQLVPVDVLRRCLRADAAKAILAHNHPNGICIPSREDKASTALFFDELAHVGVELFDHIIVAGNDVYSMKEHNMFPKQANVYR